MGRPWIIPEFLVQKRSMYLSNDIIEVSKGIDEDRIKAQKSKKLRGVNDLIESHKEIRSQYGLEKGEVAGHLNTNAWLKVKGVDDDEDEGGHGGLSR